MPATTNDYLGEWIHLALHHPNGVEQWQNAFDDARVAWQLAQAQHLLREAKRATLAAKDRSAIYYVEGLFYAQLGDWKQAVDRMMKALDLLEDTEYVEEGIIVLNDLGMVLRLQGNQDGASAAHQQALALSQEIDDPYLIADALEQIGLDFMHTAAFAEALQCFQQALVRREAIGDREGMVRNLNHLSDAYRQLGQLQEARAMLERCQNSLDAGDSDAYLAAQITANLGNIHFEEENLAQAESCWLSALTVFDQLLVVFDKVAVLNNLGGLAFRREDHATATEYYARSLDLARELGDELGVRTALTNLALILEAPDAAIRSDEDAD